MNSYEKKLPVGSMLDNCDDFWDISKLVPKKKAAASSFSTKEKTHDVVIKSSDTEKLTADDKKINFEIYKSEVKEGVKSRTYTPVNSKLISSVSILPSIDRFDFHDTFRKAALIYFDYKCPKCDFVPFYSYMPQYSQMTLEQKKYYFYWRDELRRGRYLKIDYSYIYLYAYEILNLPEKIGKEEGLSLLCNVWAAYRKTLPRLDSSFSAWVQDYCLIYGLECPYDKLGEFLFDVINASSFKEFYLSDIYGGAGAASAMIAYLSDYDWRRGKYAGGESSDMYRAHIEGSMSRVFTRLLSSDSLIKSEPMKISRTAFPGSLCTHSVKCRIEIEYYSLSTSSRLREAVTAALKYTENKIRALLGVKSRLAVKDLPDELRLVMDDYFDTEFVRLQRERARASLPEYERLYDAPEEKISFENALIIERDSWKMTARLTEASEAYEMEEIIQTGKSETLCAPMQENGKDDRRYGLGEAALSFIRAALDGDFSKERALSAECGMPCGALAEQINEAFSDNFGDVILEETDGGFKVIDDYYEEISEWSL